MKIKEISWKNICSYGNKEHTLKFTDDGGLWQICGESGAGKSTILTMPKLALFQKIDSNIGDIANRINKNGWIKCVVESDGIDYTIIRKYDPNGFELYKDGKEIENATKKGKEDVIRTEILKNIPVDVINNVIILSLNHFVSFTNMKTGDKKDIINNIIDISSIDDAESKLGEVIKSEVLKYNNLDNEIKRLEFGNNTEVSNLNRVKSSKESISSYANVSESELDDKIVKCDEDITLANTESPKLVNEQNGYVNIINQGKERIYKINGKLSVLNGEISLYESGMCPTCHRAIDMSDDSVIEHHNSNLASVEQLKSAVSQCQTIIDETTEKYNEIGGKITQLNNNYRTALSNKSTYETMKSNISAYKSIDETISNMQENIDKNILTIDAKKEELKRQERKLTLLKDRLKYLYGINGVKKQLYGSVIPILNGEISKVLGFINFPYTMDFDDSFDAHIYHMGEEISYTTLSEGEKKKVDICVICAMIKLIKNKFPQLNVLCLDETLSSLDNISSVNVLTYLKGLAKELGMNILVVSHTTLDESLFEHRLMIQKDTDGFSDIEEL